jgi:dCMP deaminase
MTKAGQDYDKCICLHAEQNAVTEAGRKNAKGGTIYVSLYPCLGCAKVMV